MLHPRGCNLSGLRLFRRPGGLGSCDKGGVLATKCVKTGLPLKTFGVCTKMHCRCGRVRLVDGAHSATGDPGDGCCAGGSLFPSLGVDCRLARGRRLHLTCKGSIGHTRFHRISDSMCCSFSLTDPMRKGPSLGSTCVRGVSFHCRCCPSNKRIVSMTLFCGGFRGPVR